MRGRATLGWGTGDSRNLRSDFLLKYAGISALRVAREHSPVRLINPSSLLLSSPRPRPPRTCGSVPLASTWCRCRGARAEGPQEAGAQSSSSETAPKALLQHNWLPPRLGDWAPIPPQSAAPRTARLGEVPVCVRSRGASRAGQASDPLLSISPHPPQEALQAFLAGSPRRCPPASP